MFNFDRQNSHYDFMKQVLPLFLCLLFTKCVVVKTSPSEGALIITTIEAGVLTGGGEEGYNQAVIAINSIDEWFTIAEGMNSVNRVNYNLKIEGFDFMNNNLYIYFDKLRSTSGYSLLVNEKKNAIVLTSTRPNGPAAEVLSQPFLLFSTNKMASEPLIIYIEN